MHHSPAPAPRAPPPSLQAALNLVPCRLLVPHFPSPFDQQLVVVGSAPVLGEWDVANGVRLRQFEGPEGAPYGWEGEAALPTDCKIAAKVSAWGGGVRACECVFMGVVLHVRGFLCHMGGGRGRPAHGLQDCRQGVCMRVCVSLQE